MQAANKLSHGSPSCVARDRKLASSWFSAIKDNKIDVVNKMLTRGVDINAVDRVSGLPNHLMISYCYLFSAIRLKNYLENERSSYFMLRCRLKNPRNYCCYSNSYPLYTGRSDSVLLVKWKKLHLRLPI